jgi:hypothetical protein
METFSTNTLEVDSDGFQCSDQIIIQMHKKESKRRIQQKTTGNIPKCSKVTKKKQTHEDDDETTPYQVATGAPKFERSVAEISKKEQRSTYGTYISLDRNRALV